MSSVFKPHWPLMTEEKPKKGKHRDSREIRRVRGQQVIVTFEDPDKGRYKGILDKRKKK